MTRSLSPAVQKLIDAYARELPARCAALHAAAPLDGDRDTLQHYIGEVHKLAGSSGSYGFRPLSEALRAIDRYGNDALAGNVTWDYAEDRRLWEAAFSALNPLS